MRKTSLALALAATVGLGALTAPSAAEARWGHGGWGWGPAVAGGLLAGAVIGGIASNAYAYGPGYGDYGGYAPAYYGYGYGPGYYDDDYGPGSYGGYTTTYYSSPSYYRYRRVVRPAYAYYGPRFHHRRHWRHW